MDDFIVTDEELCSEEEWRGLFSSRAWKEYLDTVRLRLSGTRSSLEVCDGDPLTVGRLQGEAQEARFTMAFESLIMGEIDSKRKEQDNGRDDRAE